MAPSSARCVARYHAARQPGSRPGDRPGQDNATVDDRRPTGLERAPWDDKRRPVGRLQNVQYVVGGREHTHWRVIRRSVTRSPAARNTVCCISMDLYTYLAHDSEVHGCKHQVQTAVVAEKSADDANLQDPRKLSACCSNRF